MFAFVFVLDVNVIDVVVVGIVDEVLGVLNGIVATRLLE